MSTSVTFPSSESRAGSARMCGSTTRTHELGSAFAIAS